MNDQPPTDASRPPVAEPPSSVPPPPHVWAYPAPPAEPRGGGAFKRVGVTLLVSVFLASLIANVYFIGVILPFFSSGLQEQTYTDGESEQRIVILPIEGVINAERAEFVRRALKQLDNDPPAALVVRIDSPGGAVTASDQIYKNITEFRKRHEIPVIASFGAFAASGGYYAGVAADHIVCEETGVTGSIGVLAQHLSGEKLLQKVGVEARVIVADGSPRKAVANDPTRSWYGTDGQLTEYGEESRKALGGLLNAYYDRFVAVVHEGRPGLGTLEDVKAVATGDFYTADQALEKKLVDQIGYLDDAIEEAASRAQLQNPRVTRISPPGPPLLRSLAGAALSPRGMIDPGAGAVRELRRTAIEMQGWSFRYASPLVAGPID
ncbi:MAG: signal peptide peptidase SppA [Planctomycetota bacterium]